MVKIYNQTLNQHEIKNKMIFLSNSVIKFRDDWQVPACTEKLSFYNHLFHRPDVIDQTYIACPWATIIDHQLVNNYNLEDNYISMMSNVIRSKNGKKHTVCQHIYWKKLIDLWTTIGITDVHLSHYEKNVVNTDQIKFHSFILTASNYENKDRSLGLSIKSNDNKKYLASFIGAHTKYYRNSIRLQLKNLFATSNNILFEINDEWFYQKIVYENQIKNMSISAADFINHNSKTIRYNEILSDSIFSLCPEGSGPNTLRVWESMSIGVIPVIFSDEWIPPSIPNLDWKDFYIFINQKDIPYTLDILKSISSKDIEIMKLNCLNAYKMFRQITCF